MNLFDFLYLHLFRFYSRFGDRFPATTASAVVGGFQACNILTLIICLRSVFDVEFLMNKLFWGAVGILFQVSTYIRYIHNKRHSVSLLEERWVLLADERKVWYRVAMLLYGVFSLILLFGLAIYFGNRNKVSD